MIPPCLLLSEQSNWHTKAKCSLRREKGMGGRLPCQERLTMLAIAVAVYRASAWDGAADPVDFTAERIGDVKAEAGQTIANVRS
jgi:hypothetical protein